MRNLVILVIFIMGCATASKHTLVSMKCKNCKTAYGQGELVEFTMNRTVSINRE